MPFAVVLRLVSLLVVLSSFFHTVGSFTTTTTTTKDHLHHHTIRIIQQTSSSSAINHHKTLLFFAAKTKQGDSNDKDVITLIHSHHLLDHKPDNMILRGGKFKLRGVGCLGRPGIALCIGPQKSIDKFISKLKSAMPTAKKIWS